MELFPKYNPEPDMLSFAELSYDQAFVNLQALLKRLGTKPKGRNEAATRLQIIDAVLFDCLGWNRDECNVEERIAEGAGYADYIFSVTRPILVVEAKKEGASFDLPPEATLATREVTLGSLKRNNPQLTAAVNQVTMYCAHKGIVNAIVTNGHQWVAFAAIRTDAPPDSGRCIVYPSLDLLLEAFPTAWRFLSKDGFIDGTLTRYIVGSPEPRLPRKLSQTLDSYPGLKDRNPFQANLQSVSEIVLEDITKSREFEPEFLKACYCTSGALSQFSMLTRDILKERYSSIFETNSGAPVLEAATLENRSLFAEPASKRPILLIGDVGVGKSTFVKHMLLDSDIAATSAILYVDLGSRLALTTDLRASVISGIEDELLDSYQIDIRESAFVRSMYVGDLKRLQRSIFKQERERDLAAFQAREERLLEQKMQETDKHIGSAISHIVKSHHRQVILILDNCDQRDDQTQQQSFLIAQEIAANWDATVFLALRPETYNASRSRGALTAYHVKAFTIAPPRLDEVINKRLEFGLKITNGEVPLGAQYSGITVAFPVLSSLIKAFLQSLHDNAWLIECIDNVSGGNVRLALDLVRGFLGSGHVNTRKIVETYDKEGRYIVPLHEFVRAMIYLDNVYYDPSASPVANLFDLSSLDVKEHFLQAILLGLLQSSSDQSVERGFVKSSRVYTEIQNVGFSGEQVDAALKRLIRKKLVEASARRLPEVGSVQESALRITSIGLYHLQRLARQFAYYDAVVVDVPILSDETRSQILEAGSLDQRVRRVEIFLDYLNQIWDRSQLRGLWFDWDTTLKDARHNLSQVRRDAKRAALRYGR